MLENRSLVRGRPSALFFLRGTCLSDFDEPCVGGYFRAGFSAVGPSNPDAFFTWAEQNSLTGVLRPVASSYFHLSNGTEDLGVSKTHCGADGIRIVLGANQANTKSWLAVDILKEVQWAMVLSDGDVSAAIMVEVRQR